MIIHFFDNQTFGEIIFGYNLSEETEYLDKVPSISKATLVWLATYCSPGCPH